MRMMMKGFSDMKDQFKKGKLKMPKIPKHMRNFQNKFPF